MNYNSDLGMKKSIRLSTGKIHIRFQVSLIFIIFLVLAVTSFSTIFAVLSISRQVSEDKAENLFDETGTAIKLKLDSQIDQAKHLAGLMSTLPFFTDGIEPEKTDYSYLRFIIRALEQNSSLYSVYIGYKSGEFLQIIKTSANPVVLSAHSAPENTEYILRLISQSDENRQEQWVFFNSGLKILDQYVKTDPQYIPSDRPWFQDALREAPNVILTDPYMFNSLKHPGITAAAAVSEDIVTGVDITLSNLKQFVDNIHISENAGVLILDDNDRIIAANSAITDSFSFSGDNLVTLNSLNALGYSDFQSEDYFIWDHPWKIPGGADYRILITAPKKDFMGHQLLIQRRIIIVSLVIFILIIPMVVILSRYMSRFLEHLALDAGRIQDFIFNGEINEHSPIVEFEELAVAFKVMKSAIAVKTEELKISMGKLERIIELGIAMSIEESPEALVEMILMGAKELSGADGGSLYLKGKSDELEFKIVLNDSLGIAQGGTSSTPVTLPAVKLYEENGKPNFHNVVSSAFHKGETIIIDDAYSDPEFDFSGTKKFDELNNYYSKSFMTVPLKLQGSEIIGALQLINCQSKQTGEIISFSRNIRSFVEALSAQAAAILYNRNLMDSQDELFEALIKLIANAIDTKSPYTGGHCARVPVLAEMIADAAEKTDTGKLADFRFVSKEEKRAFIIGAWLHDAGKMTTPEFVVDKAVKLETIYNRIHEIRTRFEILLRDIRIEEFENISKGDTPENALSERKQKEEKLYDDFIFVARCNTGDISMTEENLHRLIEISRITWLSHFDHTAGLSREESKRLSTGYIKGEPITEFLISDKASHLIQEKDHRSKDLYNEYGFIIPHPDVLYNRGELYNLQIPYGTLTAEERYKINEHIMQTIVMLKSLPLPRGMSRIPEFGGTHHEALNGRGYPKGLDSSELSVPARIMTIADIFEALTASDRPYKKAKKLSEAIEILNTMSMDGHIDREIFIFFLESGIYMDYAEKYLPSEQMDFVDIGKYM